MTSVTGCSDTYTIMRYWAIEVGVEALVGMSPALINPMSRIGIGLKLGWPWSKVHVHESIAYLNHAFILSDMLLSVASKPYTTKTHVQKRLDYVFNMIIIIDLIGNINRGEGCMTI